MVLFYLLACGPSQPGPATEGSPSAAAMQHIATIEGDAAELIAVGERIEALEEELAKEARPTEEVLLELEAEVARARELHTRIDGQLEEAELLLRPEGGAK